MAPNTIEAKVLPKSANVVVEDANWRSQVKMELEAARNWDAAWGFLKNPEFTTCSVSSTTGKSSTLSAAEDQGGDGSSEDGERITDTSDFSSSSTSVFSTRLKTSSQKNTDPVYDELEKHFTHTRKPALLRKSPTETDSKEQSYTYPVLTSHDYGWRANQKPLEIFGRLTCRLR